MGVGEALTLTPLILAQENCLLHVLLHVLLLCWALGVGRWVFNSNFKNDPLERREYPSMQGIGLSADDADLR